MKAGFLLKSMRLCSDAEIWSLVRMMSQCYGGESRTAAQRELELWDAKILGDMATAACSPVEPPSSA